MKESEKWAYLRNMAMKPTLENWTLLQIERQQTEDEVKKAYCEELLMDGYMTTWCLPGTGDYSAKSVHQMKFFAGKTYTFLGAVPFSAKEVMVWGKVSDCRIDDDDLFESSMADKALENLEDFSQNSSMELVGNGARVTSSPPRTGRDFDLMSSSGLIAQSMDGQPVSYLSRSYADAEELLDPRVKTLRFGVNIITDERIQDGSEFSLPSPIGMVLNFVDSLDIHLENRTHTEIFVSSQTQRWEIAKDQRAFFEYRDRRWSLCLTENTPA